MASVAVTEPFPISRLADRYLLFDADTVTHVRRTHNICGVLIGTIPNLSQQNVFLGLPLELIPEEARVLVERGHAYVVDDAEAHRKGFIGMSRKDRLAFLQHMDHQGKERALESKRKLEERSLKALKEKGLTPKVSAPPSEAGCVSTPTPDEILFDTDHVIQLPSAKLDPHFVTPATSFPPLSKPDVDKALSLPEVPPSYPLFKHMNSKGYFSMPGLRFGCNYTLYPGDPLRFHSHFLATGMAWDDDFDLLDIVGGGRLGTGVKKAYLIGGEDLSGGEGKDEGCGEHEAVRAFSIEWAGFG